MVLSTVTVIIVIIIINIIIIIYCNLIIRLLWVSRPFSVTTVMPPRGDSCDTTWNTKLKLKLKGGGTKQGLGGSYTQNVLEKIATINNYQHNFITTTILNDIIIDMIQFSSIKIITFTHILKNNILSSKKVEKDIKLAWRGWGTKLGIGQSFVICVMLEMWGNIKMKIW